MQVVVARAAFDLDRAQGGAHTDELVIFHPGISRAIPVIAEVGRRLGFTVHDFSQEMARVFEAMSGGG